MLVMALLLAAASVYVEYYLVSHSKVLQQLMRSRRSAMLALCFSMTLSVLLGGVFGAAGLIVMIAGLLSTIAMQPVYRLMRDEKWPKLVRDVKRTVAVCVAIVSFPFIVIYKVVKFVGACIDWMQVQNQRVQAAKVKMSQRFSR